MRGVWVQVVAGVAMAAMAGQAEARIRLSDAQIMAGVLVVGGWTKDRNVTVTLDEKFSQTSDQRRRFVFRIPYVPANCLVTLKAGAETRTAAIANCGTIGLSGAKGERGEAGPQGIAGPPGPKGERGEAGPQGIAGPPGPKGDRGEIGATGPQGIAGPPGPMGERGEAGLVGAKGEPAARLRAITRDCKEDAPCALTCNEGEVALAAVCPGGAAALDDPRTITCANRPAATVTAFCAR